MSSIQLHCFDIEKIRFLTFVTFNLLCHKFSNPASEPLVYSRLTRLIHDSNHLQKKAHSKQSIPKQIPVLGRFRIQNERKLISHSRADLPARQRLQQDHIVFLPFWAIVNCNWHSFFLRGVICRRDSWYVTHFQAYFCAALPCQSLRIRAYNKL